MIQNWKQVKKTIKYLIKNHYVSQLSHFPNHSIKIFKRFLFLFEIGSSCGDRSIFKQNDLDKIKSKRTQLLASFFDWTISVNNFKCWHHPAHFFQIRSTDNSNHPIVGHVTFLNSHYGANTVEATPKQYVLLIFRLREYYLWYICWR